MKMADALNKKNLEKKSKLAGLAVEHIDEQPVAVPVPKERKKSFSATVCPQILTNFELAIAALNLKVMPQGLKLNKSNVTEALLALFTAESEKVSSDIIKKILSHLEK